MTSYLKTILLLALCQLTCQHHVIFEEIGEMAGALSYVHAVVPVNISGLSHAVENFKTDVRSLEALYVKKQRPTNLGADDWFNQRILDLFTLAAADADAMVANIPLTLYHHRWRYRYFDGLVHPAPAQQLARKA